MMGYSILNRAAHRPGAAASRWRPSTMCRGRSKSLSRPPAPPTTTICPSPRLQTAVSLGFIPPGPGISRPIPVSALAQDYVSCHTNSLPAGLFPPPTMAGAMGPPGSAPGPQLAVRSFRYLEGVTVQGHRPRTPPG